MSFGIARRTDRIEDVHQMESFDCKKNDSSSCINRWNKCFDKILVAEIKMKITVLGFGIAKEIFGSSEIHLEVNDVLDVRGLRVLLEGKYPPLTKLKSYMYAINEEYAEDKQIINSGDEIALIPPVSGG